MNESQDIENEPSGEDSEELSSTSEDTALEASNENTPIEGEDGKELSDAEFDNPGSVSQAPATDFAPTSPL